jgi:hypothetical protein
MTCYARPVLFLILIITAGLAALGYIGVLTAVAVTLASAVLTAVLIIRVIMVTSRRRAASGACTTCRHPCQGRPVVFIDETSLTVPPRWPDSPATAGQDKLARLIATARQ